MQCTSSLHLWRNFAWNGFRVQHQKGEKRHRVVQCWMSEEREKYILSAWKVRPCSWFLNPVCVCYTMFICTCVYFLCIILCNIMCIFCVTCVFIMCIFMCILVWIFMWIFVWSSLKENTVVPSFAPGSSDSQTNTPFLASQNYLISWWWRWWWRWRWWWWWWWWRWRPWWWWWW